jgi:ABC-type spermidine/putrescine transport system permease subunit I
MTQPAPRPRTASDAIVIGFAVLWVGLMILPLGLMLVYSLFTTEGFSTSFTPSTETWATLFSSGRWIVGARTFVMAASVTAVTLVVAFPFAFWLAKRCRSDRVRATILVALTIPFFLETTSRTIVWRTILGSEGLLNAGLEALGLPAQTWLLYSGFSVQFGMVILFFPSMVFPIYMSLDLIDDALIAAAEDIGARPAQVMWLVVLPLAMPGILAGIIFTMVPVLAEFVVPQLLGGSNVNLLGNSINAALAALKYPTAAALSAFVLAVLVVLCAALLIFARRSQTIRGAFSEMRQ